MRPLNITMCQFDLPPGPGSGVAHQVSRLSGALQHRGHNITVLTTEPRSSQLFEMRRLRVPSASLRHKSLRLLTTPLGFALSSYARQDVVHCHGDSQLLWRSHVPIVRTFHGTARDESRYALTAKRRISQAALAPMEALAKRLATVTVGVSQSTGTTLGRLDLIIPCGVDHGQFFPGQKSPDPSVLFVGTVGGRKRGRLLVAEFAEVVRSSVSNAELWMVCPDPLPDNIRGVRWFRDLGDLHLATLFRQAWVFCLPSTYEGFGVPYIEALASGTVVVATRNDGATEIFRESEAGTVVDDDKLGLTIVHLLSDERRRLAMQEHARVDSARYSWDVIATAYEEAYSLAMSRRLSER